jgi:hypothetical protein
MWESIEESQQTKHNLTWLVEGMKSNTLIWVTDGLYDRKRAADLCRQNRTTVDQHILGEEPSGEFISGRNARPMHPTPLRQSVVRVL